MPETVKIDRMAYGSSGIGHLKDGKTVFVSGAVTGDIARVNITQEKSSYAKAKAIEIIEPSPLRAESIPCDVCAECGGCSWAALAYEAQLEAKRANVLEALVRNGGVNRSDAENLVAPCVPSKREWGYRNKIELAAFNGSDGKQDAKLDGKSDGTIGTKSGTKPHTKPYSKFALGMHMPETDNIVQIERCPLANRLIENAPKAITGALRFLNGRADLGIFRLQLRASLRTKSVEIALWTRPSEFPRAEVAKTLNSAVKATSIVRVLAEPGKARKVRKVEVLSGDGFWRESFTGASISYAVSAPSFFQVNTAQAEKLVDLVLSKIDSISGKNVADLYSGVGTFSIPLAQAGANVVAIEVAGSSSRDARRNAQHAHVHIDTLCEDAARAFPKIKSLDALVVDPPRAGLAPQVISQIAIVRPNTIAYISCDPQTLARDVRALCHQGYNLVAAIPVDLFPQTYHIETLALFC